jgi:hypothetical protein
MEFAQNHLAYSCSMVIHFYLIATDVLYSDKTNLTYYLSIINLDGKLYNPR